MEDELLTISQAAEILGVSAATLRRWDRNGRLPAQRHPINNYRVYSRRQLDAHRGDCSADLRGTRATPLAYTTPFVGRQDELATLRKRYAEGARLVTLVGPPGIGKTRLAHELLGLGGSLVDGAIFCDLTEANDADEVGLAVLTALGGTVLKQKLGPEAVTRALHAAEPSLLVLDNFEQVTRAAAATVGVWAESVPALRLLVTSRERLRLAGEVVIELPPLALDAPGRDLSEAARLFAWRAADAAGRDLLSPADHATVETLVRRLDGIPLAIELAAARASVLGPGDLLERLGGHLDLFRDRSRDSARQATLRGAIDWSWRLLSRADRLALERLSVFRGGFDLAAAEVVVDATAAGGASVIEALTSLRDKSLLWVEVPASFPRRRRFRLFLSIRDYAAERLEGSEAQAIRDRHAEYYLNPQQPWCLEPDSDQISAALELERENVLAAYRHAVAAPPTRRRAEWGLRALQVLRPLLLEQSAQRAVEMLAAALERARDAEADVGLRARSLELQSVFLRQLARLDDARSALMEALELARRAEAVALEAQVLSWLAFVTRQLGDPEASAAHARDAYALATRHQLHRIRIKSLAAITAMHLERGESGEAEATLERQLAISREIGDSLLEAKVMAQLAPVLQDRGQKERAHALYNRALDLARELDNRRTEGILLGYLASLEHERGELTAARRDYEAAIGHLAALDAVRGLSVFTSGLGAVLVELGELELAETTFERAAELLGRYRDPSLRGTLDLHCGHLDLVAAIQSLAAADTPAAARHLADARARLVAATTPSAVGGRSIVERLDDARYAYRRLRQRVIEVSLRLTGDRTDGVSAVTVHPVGRWFRLAGRDRVDLDRREPLRRIVNRLVDERLRAPGRPMTRGDLVAAGWPGEVILDDAAAHRLRVAIYELRKLGLEDLLTVDDGYLLDPAHPLRFEI